MCRLSFVQKSLSEDCAMKKEKGIRGGPSLVVAIAKAYGFTFCVAGIFKVGQDLLSFVSPQLLK